MKAFIQDGGQLYVVLCKKKIKKRVNSNFKQITLLPNICVCVN